MTAKDKNLNDLFLDTLKDVYFAEKQILKALPKMAKAARSDKLRAAFDFANFILAGEKPIDNWPALKPYTVHIHIKDARLSDKKIVPAGQGDGDIGRILKDAYDSGYRGFLTMEPHLAKGGQFSGFSGPDLFKVAVDALKDVCRRNSVPLAGA